MTSNGAICSPPRAGDLRYSFYVINLPLDTSLELGRFTIEPLPEGQLELGKAHSLSTSDIVTGRGTVPFESEQNLPEIEELVDHVCRLCGFACRNSIRPVFWEREVFEGSGWSSSGSVPQTFPTIGTVKPRPIYSTTSLLQDFVTRNLPKLISDNKYNSTGILSAIRFFNATTETDYTESRYLKTWIALEILFSKFDGNLPILSSSNQKKLRRSVNACLAQLTEEGSVTEIEKGYVLDKVGELSHKSAKQKAMPFFESVFSLAPQLIPNGDEFDRLSGVRNQIGHTGVMKLPIGFTEYTIELIRIRLQLSNLVELSILGHLEEFDALADKDWRYVRGNDSSVH